MPSDKPSNRQSVNTGIRLNPTTPALLLVRCGRAFKLFRTIKGKPSRELPSDTSLPDKLNAFYARFKTSNTEACMRAPAVPDHSVITLSVADVRKTYKQVNNHKAMGPNGLPGNHVRTNWQVSSMTFSTSL